MIAHELTRTIEAPGPLLSAYIATGGVESAGPRVGLYAHLRWKGVRPELEREGAPASLLDPIDTLIEAAPRSLGTLAVIASGERGIVLARHLPRRPPYDRDAVTRWGVLPWLLPLLAQAQTLVPHVAVLASRAAAEIASRTAEPDAFERPAEVEVSGRGGPQLTRSKPGGWSQPRYQHRAEVLWEHNAAEVAANLAKVVDGVRPRFVAVAGDVRAVQLLRDESPKRVQDLIQVVGGELGSIDEVLAAADRLVEATVAGDTRALLDRFDEERGQDDRAADGVRPTLDALGMGQVETLLVVDRAGDDRTTWIGDRPELLSPDREQLAAEGVAEPIEAPLVDAAVRAALGTSAAVRVLDPDAEDAPSEGIGGLLRFRVSP
jgi:Bacterial archaeo-eukaryotic release factor family 2